MDPRTGRYVSAKHRTGGFIYRYPTNIDPTNTQGLINTRLTAAIAINGGFAPLPLRSTSGGLSVIRERGPDAYFTQMRESDNFIWFYGSERLEEIPLTQKLLAEPDLTKRYEILSRAMGTSEELPPFDPNQITKTLVAFLDWYSFYVPHLISNPQEVAVATSVSESVTYLKNGFRIMMGVMRSRIPELLAVGDTSPGLSTFVSNVSKWLSSSERGINQIMTEKILYWLDCMDKDPYYPYDSNLREMHYHELLKMTDYFSRKVLIEVCKRFLKIDKFLLIRAEEFNDRVIHPFSWRLERVRRIIEQWIASHEKEYKEEGLVFPEVMTDEEIKALEQKASEAANGDFYKFVVNQLQQEKI